MVKYQNKNITKKQSTIQKKISPRRNVKKNFNNKKRSHKRNNRISQTEKQKRSISVRSKESIKTFSSESSDEKMKPILLPDEILSIAKENLDGVYSLKNLENAINIYDIDDDLIYNYLDKCGKINKDK